MRVADPRPRSKGDALRRLAIVSDGGEVVARRCCTGRLVEGSPVVAPNAVVPGGTHCFFLRVSSTSGRGRLDGTHLDEPALTVTSA